MSGTVSVGDEFGRYHVVRQVGAGGMGVVYAARDTLLDREVALKVIAPHQADNAEHRARFEREAAIMARIDSHHVVSVYDYGERDGSLFLVTQLVNGGDLDAHLRREGRLEPAVVTGLLAQVCHGLAQAHAAGVTHRDVKPSNVLLRQDGRGPEAVLCDFGIASMPGVELTRTGAITGSLLYMAPERHRGESAGVAGDIYSAGCLLWFALTGAAPYAGTEVEIAMAHLEAPIPQLPGKDDFSRRINQVLSQSMAKDPASRYRSAHAMETDLQAASVVAPAAVALPEHTSIRRPITATTVSARRARLPWIAVTAASVVTALVLGLMLFSRGERTLADLPILPAQASTTPLPPAPSSTVVQRRIDPEEPARSERPGKRLKQRIPGLKALPLATEDPITVPGQPSTSQAPDPGPASNQNEPKPDPDGGDGGKQQPDRDPAPTKEPSPTQEPEPEYQYTCWNGTDAYEYADCSQPYGSVGADWIFPRYSDLGCVAYNIKGTAGDIESWICNYVGPEAGKNWITFARWKSAKAARTYYRSNYDPDFFGSNPWRPNGYYFGTHYWGRSDAAAGKRRYRDTRIYQAQPWTRHVNAANKPNRQHGMQLSTGFRHPTNFNGVPK